MATIDTSEGPFEIPDATKIRAVARHGERQADLTAAYLEATGIFKSKPIYLPAAFLLELAAVLELGMWERQGVRSRLDVDLPTYREASQSLGERAMRGPSEFANTGTPPLSIAVMNVWLEHFAWDGPEFLGTDVVVDNLDEDTFIDLLAEFVWTHRQELEQLVRGDTDHDQT